MASIMDGDSSEFESALTRQKKSQRKRKIQSDLESDCSSVAKFKDPRRPAKQKVTDSGPKSDAPTTAPLRDEDTGSPTSIQDLKSRSEKAYRKVLAFLTSPENAADHETVGFVMASIGKFQALLNESLLYSSRLEGRIESLTAENIDQRRVVSSAVEKCSSQPPPHHTQLVHERETRALGRKVGTFSYKRQTRHQEAPHYQNRIPRHPHGSDDEVPRSAVRYGHEGKLSCSYGQNEVHREV